MTTARKPKMKRTKAVTWTRWARVCGGDILYVYDTEYGAGMDHCTNCRVIPVEIRALPVRKRKALEKPR